MRLLLLLLIASPALADEVRDERRLWSDGSVQEVWTYDGSILPESLIRKEWFYEDGQAERIEHFVAGVQHGDTRTWHHDGNKAIEETWVDGGRHGVVRHWPNPGEDRERKKQLKPELEAEWANGKRHGAWREFQDWGEHRWMRVERAFVEDELDGFETIWRRKDEMDRKHSYAAGKLHGKQLAWDHNGRMEYQFHFEDGLPHGPQRKYEGEASKVELFFDHGRLHGDCTWEDWQSLGVVWRNGLLAVPHTRERDDEPDYIDRISRYEFVPEERFDNSGRLRFYGDTRLVDTQQFDEQGRRTRYVAEVPGKFTMEFWPDGSPRRLGLGRGLDGAFGRQIQLYEDGTLEREEFHDSHKKQGVWGVWDRDGNRVSTLTWDFYLQEHLVTTWHEPGVRASQGNIAVGQGSESGRKVGNWTYWRPDGSELRTERYDHGPYSGNRHFIVEMVEYNADGTVRFDGSEGELLLYDYNDDGALVRRRTVKLLDRSRHQLEHWDHEAKTMLRHEPKEVDRAKLDAGADTVELLGGRGLVNSAKTRTEYDRDGTPVAMRGWYPGGQLAYEIKFMRGAVVGAHEFWSDGSPRLVVLMGSGADGPVIASLQATDKSGRSWDVATAGARFKGPVELLQACRLWKLLPDLARPVGWQ